MPRRRAEPRSRTRFAAVCVVVGLASVAGEARADATFALAWRTKGGAPACVTEAAIRDGVEKKLGRKPFTEPGRAEIIIEGEEHVAGGHFRARLIQRDRAGVLLGSRDLDAASCSSLIRTTTVVVALFIEPGGPSEGSAVDPDPAPSGGAPAKPPETSPPASEVPPPKKTERSRAQAPIAREKPRHAFDLSLGIGAGAAIGLLPSMNATLRVVARLAHTRSRWSFEWSGGYALPQTLRDGSVRGTFSAVDQQLRGCWAFLDGEKLRFDGCGGVFWGAIVPSTRGVRDSNDAWRPLAAPTVTVALQLREAAASTRIELGLAAPPLRRVLYYLSSDNEPERFFATSRVIVFAGFSGLLTIL